VLFILASSPCCTSIPSEVFNTEKDEIQSNLAFFDELFNSNNASIGPLSNRTVLQYESSNGPLNFTLCHLAVFLNNLEVPSFNGIRQAASVLMALHDFNTGNDSIVPQMRQCNVGEFKLRFTMEFVDTIREPLTASTGLLNILQRKNRRVQTAQNGTLVQAYPSGIIGAVRSAVTSPLSQFGSVNDLVTISHASTSDELRSEQEYPLFGRTIPSTTADAVAVVSYFREVLNATHVGVLYANDVFGTSFARSIQTEAGRGNSSISVTLVALPVDASANEAMASLQQLNVTGFRYFVGILFDRDFRTVMPLAYDMGIAGEKYLWMFTQSQLQLMNSPLTAGTNLARAVHGSAVLATVTGNDLLQGTRFYDEYTSRFSKLWNSEVGWKYLQSKLPQTAMTKDLIEGSEPGPFELFLYEAVVAMCLASCDAAEKAGSDFFTANGLYDSFTRTNFDGAYGQVAFDRKTGDRRGDSARYAVYNIVSNETTFNIDATHQQVFKKEMKQGLDNIYSAPRQMVWETYPNEHFIDGSSAEHLFMVERKHQQVFEKEKKQGVESMYSVSRQIVWNAVLNRKFIYADGTSNPPSNLPPLTEDSKRISATAVPLSLSGVAMCTSIACFVWTYKKRKTKVVCASQPFFLYIICAGTLMMGSSLIPNSLLTFDFSQDILNRSCVSRAWLFHLGFVVTHSALFSKTMRIFKVRARTLDCDGEDGR